MKFTASQNCINLIKEHEGFKPLAYLCPAGVWTIGYGTTTGVKSGMTITQAQAEVRLKQDVRMVEAQLNAMNLPLKQGQYDALVSFIYNAGWGNFIKSTLLQLVVSNPNNAHIPDEFRKWRMGNGAILPGLVRRREAEIKLYLS